MTICVDDLKLSDHAQWFRSLFQFLFWVKNVIAFIKIISFRDSNRNEKKYEEAVSTDRSNARGTWESEVISIQTVFGEVFNTSAWSSMMRAAGGNVWWLVICFKMWSCQFEALKSSARIEYKYDNMSSEIFSSPSLHLTWLTRLISQKSANWTVQSKSQFCSLGYCSGSSIFHGNLY